MVVVVSVVVEGDISGLGVAVSIGIAVSIGVAVVVVVVELEELSDEVVASGEGDATGVTVSVFCSQATRSAAPARMQMYFFIIFLD